METADLYRWMDDPSLLSTQTLAELETWAGRFPYFQTVRLLYLKNLAVLRDPRLEAEIEKTAVALPDRRRLFYYLEGDRYGLPLLPESPAEKDETPDSFSLIDAFLSTCPGEKNASEAVLFQPSVSSDYLYWSLSSAGKPAEGGDAAAAANEPEEMQAREETSPGNPLQAQPADKGMELIDNFLRDEEERGSSARLRAADEMAPATASSPLKSPEDAHLKSLDDSYFTETLARIYVKQKRYEKALQIIKNLSLKYPEKNVYFADQIRFLEKLIINTKK